MAVSIYTGYYAQSDASPPDAIGQADLISFRPSAYFFPPHLGKFYIV